MKHRAITGFLVLVTVVGSWQFGHGAWIYVKAQVAQYLLQQAWVQTVDGDHHVHPWPWADTWPVARLQAPSHRQSLIVLSGANGRTLAFGPALVNEALHKNASGTIVISGHRDTYFRFLRRLRKGDALIFEQVGRTHRHYRVDDVQIIDSRTTSIINDPERDQLVLVTCYPFDAMVPGGPLRYVVIAEKELWRSVPLVRSITY